MEGSGVCLEKGYRSDLLVFHTSVYEQNLGQRHMDAKVDLRSLIVKW